MMYEDMNRRECPHQGKPFISTGQPNELKFNFETTANPKKRTMSDSDEDLIFLWKGLCEKLRKRHILNTELDDSTRTKKIIDKFGVVKTIRVIPTDIHTVYKFANGKTEMDSLIETLSDSLHISDGVVNGVTIELTGDIICCTFNGWKDVMQ